MTVPKRITEYLKKNTDMAFDIFNEELSSDENRDYRRGFRAGILCAFLQLKAELSDISQEDN